MAGLTPASTDDTQTLPAKGTVAINPKLEPEWKAALADEFRQPYFQELKRFLVEERRLGRVVFPPGPHIFNALNLTPLSKVKVVILGQDPYHGPGQAHGLCFSVQTGVQPPPSLVNIFKELAGDVGFRHPGHGNLERWAHQGVLLLNTSLTVRAHQAGSHHGKGWEQFTDAIIHNVCARREGLIFLLWGRPAQSKEALIDTTRHHVLKAPHPSPLSASRGFFGCRHFSRTNELLVTMGASPIDWQL